MQSDAIVPATFQRLMEQCLHGLLHKECLVYLDDVIIYSATVEEHLERLQHVFQRLQEFGLKPSSSKCQFMRERISYLGHVISANGSETDQSKTEVLRTWPIPTSVADFRKFLGFSGYFRRFIRLFEVSQTSE